MVAGLLRPGGRLFVRDGHPVLWALDEHHNPPALREPRRLAASSTLAAAKA
ncbi:hypothetical protein [Goodfellowiella coeruleoviolacea]|uniref:Methyltransferase n=1 Tax=Goodfellowiella coeruleoviolacea TaxID=334858 RepID=A0AAE3KFK1_9PSEU|nr:hypothetical protein [Goodfellowiella coeruleoviolacea]MCP2166446.1 hypothetical protein [Goodfellowiella coeruleoviolacea]